MKCFAVVCYVGYLSDFRTFSMRATQKEENKSYLLKWKLYFDID